MTDEVRSLLERILLLPEATPLSFVQRETRKVLDAHEARVARALARRHAPDLPGQTIIPETAHVAAPVFTDAN